MGFGATCDSQNPIIICRFILSRSISARNSKLPPRKELGWPTQPFARAATTTSRPASKACALALVPIPDYADAMERENAHSKKKYGDRFNIRDDEVIDDDDDVMGLLPGGEFDGDRNGIVLA